MSSTPGNSGHFLIGDTSSPSASPPRSLGFPILGESFAYVTGVFLFVLFFNPTIEVVTFRLRGWCMLRVLPAFTRLGHERQDLLSSCDGMHVCTD